VILSGAIWELRMLIDRALDMGAQAINFAVPHHAIAVSRTGEYSYFRCSMLFSHAAALPRAELKGLQKYFRLAWRQRNQFPNSVYYRMAFDHVEITEKQIKFDQNEEFVFEYETNFVPIEQESALDDKVATLAMSAVMPGHPYIRLKPSIINTLHGQLVKHITVHIGEHNHESLNTLVAKDGALYYMRDPQQDHTKYIKGEKHTKFTEDFTVYKEYEGVPFFLYDIDLVTFRKLCRLSMIENIIIVPFQNFYIIEGHGEELMCKFNMRLRTEIAPR
jgi:hypothetical protein